MCFFKNQEEQRQYLAPQLKRYYPNFISGDYFFRKYLEKEITPESIVLDLGCGDNGLISKFKGRVGEIIGLDIDANRLSQNQVVDRKILSEAENIPLPDQSIDIISSEFVLEHIANREVVIKEIYRVLKPGGVFIFITPNLNNPIIFLSKLLPYWIHRLFVRQVLKKIVEPDITYYQLNIKSQLITLVYQVGFKSVIIERAGNPEYLAITKFLTIPAILFERLLNIGWFRNFKMYLIGCVIK